MWMVENDFIDIREYMQLHCYIYSVIQYSLKDMDCFKVIGSMLLIFTFLINVAEADLGKVGKLPVWVLLLIIGFIILVALACCFYRYCCRNRPSGSRLQKEEEEFDLKRKNLKVQHTERETEREKKRDEMRKKYGINKDDTDDALVN